MEEGMQPRLRLPDRKSKVTVKEVAQRAGVGESTVSRIMRNKGPVAEETRKRVMEAVRATGYVPNRIAGSLASLDSHLVGVVIPSLSNIVFPEVLQGIHAALWESENQPVISVTEYDIEREEAVVRGAFVLAAERDPDRRFRSYRDNAPDADPERYPRRGNDGY